jgi:hypothetical protein
MASLAIAAAGATIGGAIGWGTSYAGVAIALGWTAGATLGNALFPTKQPSQNYEGPRINELPIQTSSYGHPIPRVWGGARIAGNMIWTSGIKETKHVDEYSTGGGKGGGGSTSTSTTYTYSSSFAIAICEGEIGDIGRIWADSQLVDAVAPDADMKDYYIQKSLAYSGAKSLTVYRGTEDQLPCPLIESYEGTGNVPAYRGIAYIVFEDFELGDYGNRRPSFEFEIVQDVETNELVFAAAAATGWPKGDTGWDFNWWGLEEGLKFPHDMAWTPYGLVFRCGNVYTPRSQRHESQMEVWDVIFVLISGFPGKVVWTTYFSRPDPYDTTSYQFQGMSYDYQRNKLRILISSNDNFKFTYLNLSDGSLEEVFEEIIINSVTSGSSRVASLDCARDGTFTIGTWITGYIGGYEKDWIQYNHWYWDTHKQAYLVSAIADVEDLWGGWQIPGPGDSWTPFGGVSLLMGILPNGDRVYSNKDMTKLAVMRGDSNSVRYYVDDIPFGQAGYGVYSYAYGGYFYNTFGVLHNSSMTSTGDILLCGMPGLSRVDTVHVFDGVSLWFHKEYKMRSKDAVMPLDFVVTDILSDVSISGDQVDVSELEGINVKGFTQSGVMSAKSLLEPLMQAYNFDLIESDWVMKAKLRVRSLTGQVDHGDLGAKIPGKDSDASMIKETRAHETDLPRRVVVKYVNKDADYLVDTQSAYRVNTLSKNELIVELPLTLTATEALRTAERLLRDAWTQRVGYEVSVPVDYIDFTPGDIVSVDNKAIRIGEATLYYPSMIHLLGTRALVDVQESTAEAPVPFFQEQYNLDTLTPTTFVVLDVPMLSDQTPDAPGVFVAGYGGDYWHGCAISKSVNGGTDWQNCGILRTAATIGTVMNTLGDGCVTRVDNANQFTVRINTPGATLSSKELPVVLSGENVAAIGKSGRWEIVGFMDAELQDDGTYLCSGLIRGLRGTEHNTANHAIYDKFVLLQASTLIWVPLDTDAISAQVAFKGETIALPATLSTQTQSTFNAVNMQPWSPCHIHAQKNEDGDIIISWTRRTRLYGGWSPYVDVALGELSEEYEVDILQEGTPIRTLTTTSDGVGVAYLAVDQATDGVDEATEISIAVYQKSTVVGRGVPAYATVRV